LNENEFFNKTGFNFNNASREKALEELLRKKYLMYKSPFWCLSEKGMLLADAIIKRLI
jgi:coproporphyrinogen III oxidase-like Fe-S oxidoreductase